MLTSYGSEVQFLGKTLFYLFWWAFLNIRNDQEWRCNKRALRILTATGPRAWKQWKRWANSLPNMRQIIGRTDQSQDRVRIYKVKRYKYQIRVYSSLVFEQLRIWSEVRASLFFCSLSSSFSWNFLYLFGFIQRNAIYYVRCFGRRKMLSGLACIS